MMENNNILNLDFLLKPFIYYTKFILTSFFIILGATTYISFKIPETFKSDSLLLIKDKYEVLNTGNTDIGSALGLLGGAGGSNASSSDLKIIEMMRSRDFFQKLYSNNDFMLHAFFIDNYNKSTGETNFSEDIYKQDGRYELPTKPPFMLAYKEYIESTIEVAQERETGLIIISSYSPSPTSAKYILDIVMNNFIEYITQRESEMAESSLSYLSSMLDKNNNQITNISLSKLIQADLQKMVLSQSKDGIIEIIDSPYTPIEKYAPSKLTFILIASLILMMTIYVGLIFLAYFKKSN